MDKITGWTASGTGALRRYDPPTENTDARAFPAPHHHSQPTSTPYFIPSSRPTLPPLLVDYTNLRSMDGTEKDDNNEKESPPLRIDPKWYAT